jgi:DUF1680 family protein
MNRAMQFLVPGAVRLGGLLGDALNANLDGRLKRFVTDEHSPPIALFRPEHVRTNEQGDWYGEHAGKWLSAASRAVLRTGDTQLRDTLRRVADYLVSRQESDGYLGTYAPSHRFMRKQPAGKRTWDGAPGVRTWDIWNHSYLVLGMLAASRCLGEAKYLECACRIGDLCWRTLSGGIDITELGNHHGMSATVLLEPAVELHFAAGPGSGNTTYLDLARLVLEQADKRPELGLLSAALAGSDAAGIGTGKAYQLAWNFVGVAKLYRATGDARLFTALLNVWENIRRFHLTLGGGPWGGVAHRSREVFNPAGVFSPHGYVETCSTFAWIEMNRELLAMTGEAKYAEEIERSAYNALLGAQAPNGEDWCYYSFPNGKRVFTTYWRCCKSSGALALEELPDAAYATAGDDIACNLYGESTAQLELPHAGTVRVQQRTDYPFDGDIRIRLTVERPTSFAVRLRVPSWATETAVSINGVPTAETAGPGTFLALTRTWRSDDEIRVVFAMPPVLHRRSNRSVQESKSPSGEPISQEVLRHDYAAITRGPLVYATGLIDDYKTEETLRLGREPLELIPATGKGELPVIRLHAEGRAPIAFTPYFAAGGRRDGTWRLTWMSLSPVAPEPRICNV